MKYKDLAIKANLIHECIDDGLYFRALENFAELIEAEVRADEREECAKVCETLEYMWNDVTKFDCAEKIRARGEVK